MHIDLGQDGKVWSPTCKRLQESRNGLSVHEFSNSRNNRVVMHKYSLACGDRLPPLYTSTLFAKVAALEKLRVKAIVRHLFLKMVWRFIEIWNMRMPI